MPGAETIFGNGRKRMRSNRPPAISMIPYRRSSQRLRAGGKIGDGFEQWRHGLFPIWRPIGIFPSNPTLENHTIKFEHGVE